jgi:hypothetical protein
MTWYQSPDEQLIATLIMNAPIILNRYIVPLSSSKGSCIRERVRDINNSSVLSLNRNPIISYSDGRI